MLTQPGSRTTDLPPVDMRGNIDQVEAAGDLLRITTEVEPHLGIPAVMKACGGMRRVPMILFENIAGYPGMRAMAGHRARNDRTQEMLGYSPEPLPGKIEFMKAMQNPLPPVRVASGPVHENVVRGRVDVTRYIPPSQGALQVNRLYYQPLCVTRDPVSGDANVGIYRACVQEPGRLTVNARWDQHGGLHMKAAMERGEPLEVALVLGVDMADWIAGGSKLPYGYDEWSFAGALRRRPTPLVKCLTVNLEVPAFAEIVIEGVIRPPYECGVDGPWPEYLNYLGGEGTPPIMDVTALTYRNNAINQVSIAGTLPEAISFGSQASFFRHVKNFAGDFVVDTNLVTASHGHHGIIKVRKTEPEHEGMHFNVGLAAFGFIHRMDRVTLVDDDVDIYDLEHVDWAITTRCNPLYQVHILGEGLSHHNNPIAGVRKVLGEPIVKAKMLTDATIPWKYRFLKKKGGVPYFTLTEWPGVDLTQVLSSEDYVKWVGRPPGGNGC